MVCAVSTKEVIEKLPPSSRIEFIEKPLSVWAVDSALLRLQGKFSVVASEITASGGATNGDAHRAERAPSNVPGQRFESGV